MRLARLDSDTLELLRVAVFGRTFEPALFAQMTQRDVEQIEEILPPPARLIRREGYTF